MAFDGAHRAAVPGDEDRVPGVRGRLARRRHALRRPSAARARTLIALAAGALWYLPFGTLVSLIQIAILATWSGVQG